MADLCNISNLPARHARRLSLFVVAVVVSLPVSGADVDKPVSFVNDVMPVLTKAGCNVGVCHAKAGGGQKGFQLSLLGFEPTEDHESLVKDGHGRRLFPAAPEQSLILRKASGQTPHGGGIRLAKDSIGYATLRRWIEQGTPFGTDSELQLVSVDVQPDRGLVKMSGEQQLAAVAKYSDGSISRSGRSS